MNKYIVIEGNIGAGKTTLVEELSKKLNYKTIFEEFNDNPFLSKFYKEPEKYAFHTEMHFLLVRYNQLKKSFSEYQNQNVISDYHISKSLIFSKNTLNLAENILFENYYNALFEHTKKPDLYIYINKPVKIVAENIHKRGREYEKGIKSEYLQAISDSYLSFIKTKLDFPVICLNTNNINFEKNDNRINKIIDIITENNTTKKFKTINL